MGSEESCIISLPDLQNQKDLRNISLERVGITNVLFPIKICKKGGSEVDVSARTRVFVGLPEEYKGVNMSRFMQCLVGFSEHVISSESMPRLLDLLGDKLKSEDAYVRFEFDYYLDKAAPVTGYVAPMSYRCAFTGIKRNGEYDLILEVNVVAASLCPCSKEMSLLGNLDVVSELSVDVDSELLEKLNNAFGCVLGMGAHNQRSNIRVEVICKPGSILWLEDLIDLVEAQASAPVYPILKRPDEKYVTELAYKNAKFSEDITRDVQMALEENSLIDTWAIRVYNEESIHPYDVTCYQKSSTWKY